MRSELDSESYAESYEVVKGGCASFWAGRGVDKSEVL